MNLNLTKGRVVIMENNEIKNVNAAEMEIKSYFVYKCSGNVIIDSSCPSSLMSEEAVKKYIPRNNLKENNLKK